MPAVSVVMPVLNGMPYFQQALDSVCGQTLKDIEILVIDSGSTDGTVQYVMTKTASDSRIRLIHADKKSMGYQYNMGIQQASGQYIGFCESDDYVNRNMFSDLYLEARRNSFPDTVKSDFYMFFSEAGDEFSLYYGVLPRRQRRYYEILNISEMPELFMRDLNMWNGIFLRDFLRGNNIRLNETNGAAFQDTDFVEQVNMLAKRQYFVEKPYYHYRRDNEGSSVYKDTLPFVIDEFLYMIEFLNKNPNIAIAFGSLCLKRMFGLFFSTYGISVYFEKNIPEENLMRLRSSLKKLINEYPIILQANMTNRDLLSFLNFPENFDALAKNNYQTTREKQNSLWIRVRNAAKFAIFGAGDKGGALYSLLKRNGYSGNIFFVDSNPEKAGTSYMGLNVLSLQETLNGNNILYGIPNERLFDEMSHILLKNGIDEHYILNADVIDAHGSMQTFLDS